MARKKDLSAYCPADEVAAQLYDIAARIKRGGGLVRYSIQLWFHDNAEGRARFGEWSDAPKVEP